MMIKGKKCLTYDINGSIYMSDASCQPYSKGRTDQSRPYPAAAVPGLARSGPAFGARLLDLGTSGVSLPRAGTATQAASPGRRCQSALHRQTFAQSGRPTSRLRRFHRIDPQRDRQPCVYGGFAPRARSWLTGRRASHELCIWNIASTDCCRTSWRRPMNCSCQTGAGRSLQARSPQTARRL